MLSFRSLIICVTYVVYVGFLRGSKVKNLPAKQRCKRCGFDSWVDKFPWRRSWKPTPVFLPGDSCGQRSLVGHGVPKSWTWLKQLSTCVWCLSRFSSVAKSSLTFCDPMDCSMPGFPVHHQLKLVFIMSVMPSNYLILCCPLSYCVQYFEASGSFPLSQFFASGGQSIESFIYSQNLWVVGWSKLKHVLHEKKKRQWFSVPEGSVEELSQWMDRLRAYAEAQRWVSIMEAHSICSVWCEVMYNT